MTNTTINRAEFVTDNNKLGLQEYDLVKTTGKGIGIVLRKKSLNDELVIYSMTSATETHPLDDDGMAKVRRYNEDGTIAKTSETTGKKLKNRDIYTITGIRSYTNPVLAMKDFVNQNPDIEFDAVIEPDVEEPVMEETPTTVPTQDEINIKILSALDKILEKLS